MHSRSHFPLSVAELHGSWRLWFHQPSNITEASLQVFNRWHNNFFQVSDLRMPASMPNSPTWPSCLQAWYQQMLWSLVLFLLSVNTATGSECTDLLGTGNIAVWRILQLYMCIEEGLFPTVLLRPSIPGGVGVRNSTASMMNCFYFCCHQEGFVSSALDYWHSLALFLRLAVPTCHSLQVGHTSDNLFSLIVMPTWMFEILSKGIPDCSSKVSAYYGVLQRFSKCFV